MTVLTVDDDPINLERLEASLHQSGFCDRVIGFCSGLRVIEQADLKSAIGEALGRLLRSGSLAIEVSIPATLKLISGRGSLKALMRMQDHGNNLIWLTNLTMTVTVKKPKTTFRPGTGKVNS